MSRDTREQVRNRYAEVADSQGGCCCGGNDASAKLGYGFEELKSLPGEADLGLGCGNPTAIAGLTEGEVVIDLGAGGGIDCFLASRRVGPVGRVIGVDMTPEMVSLARMNAEKGGYRNVEFRLGEIENLPVADAIADLVISNCVVNLSPDKERVFREAFRALRTGGRLAVSDLVLHEHLSDHLKTNAELLTGCISGALVREQYLDAIRAAGFVEVEVTRESRYLEKDDVGALASRAGVREGDARAIAANVHSITVSAKKPE